MTTYICKCGRRVKKSTDASTTGNRLSGYAPGHECWSLRSRRSLLRWAA